jgi:hypothetical protein
MAQAFDRTCRPDAQERKELLIRKRVNERMQTEMDVRGTKPRMWSSWWENVKYGGEQAEDE